MSSANTFFLDIPKPYAFDRVRIGLGLDSFRQAFLSSYSKAFYSGATGDATTYAIRLHRVASECSVNNTDYPLATDDRFKCAYRYRFIGNRAFWEELDWSNTSLTNQLIIDVVYLGEELVPTDLSTISDDSWWSMKRSQRQVISRTFPASGCIIQVENTVSGILRGRGSAVYYSVPDDRIQYSVYEPVLGGFAAAVGDEGLPVRLFRNSTP